MLPAATRRKKLITVTVLLALLFIFGAAAYSYRYTQKYDYAQALPPAGDITVRGEIVCLPHKDYNGPHTLECAFGLMDYDENYYSLKEADPSHSTIGNLPMDEPVQVEGVFTPQEDHMYDSVGVITVKKITVEDHPFDQRP